MRPNSPKQLFEPLAARAAVGLGDFEHREDILLDRHAAEDRGFLRQIAEAEDRPAVHRQIGDVLAVEEDPAAVRLDQSHDRIEAGGLAGAVGPEQADHFAAMDVERHIVKHRPPVVGLGDRVNLEPAGGDWHRGVRPDDGRGVVHGDRQPLRFGTVKWPVTRPPRWPTPGAPPSITARPVSRSMTSLEPLTRDPSRVELNVADQSDQALVQVVDAEIAARGFRGATDDHSAAGIQPLDLDSAAARISDRQAFGVHRQLGLADMDVAGENRPVGAVLDFDPVGIDIDRGLAVMPLQRGRRPLGVGKASRPGDRGRPD